MLRHLPAFATLIALATLAAPVRAETGLFVWNDPDKMAIRLASFDSADPAEITSVKVLAELTTVSSTMTGVAADGNGIGLCRQERDGNEAPAWLVGFSSKGKEIWRKPAGDFLAALEQALPRGIATGRAKDPSWFTFECKDAGGSGQPGVLAFDLGFSAGKPDADGFVVSDDTKPFIVRLHVDAKTGKPLGAALVKKGKSALVLQPNPTSILHRDANGETYMLGYDPSVIIPKGGRGRVMWGDRPFRWKGEPVIEGFDFAWFLPQP